MSEHQRQEAERLQREYVRRRIEIPAHRYAADSPGEVLLRRTRTRGLSQVLSRAATLPLQTVVDIGCGSGDLLANLEVLGARRSLLAGVDALPDRVERAAGRLPGADLRQGDATELPWPDESFDLVCQSMMFSSILDDGIRFDAAREMRRIVRPEGAILWCDFIVGNPLNAGVRRVSRGELLRLFDGFRVVVARRSLLAPPVGRVLAARSIQLAEIVERARLMNAQIIAVLKRS